LNAIGITHPLHRRKIKNEIARLNLSDGLSDFNPSTLDDWLCHLRLEEYRDRLNEQNYRQLSDITSVAWEDLEDIGITRLGHQKRFMLGIKRLIAIDKCSCPCESLTTTDSTSTHCYGLEKNRTRVCK
jgi:CASK-interacting protein